MKLSNYNVFLNYDDSTLLVFNSISCALAKADNEFMNIIQNIDFDYNQLVGSQKELVDKMIQGNYIINNDIDELKLIKYRNYMGKYNRSALGITIAPTLSCNFKCPYCYENAKSGIMNGLIQNQIMKMIEESCKHIEILNITWYGGEPLLCKEVIYEMSEKIINVCKSNKVQYSSGIITNGYLLDSETLNKLELCKINRAQITLDGPSFIHNKRRVLKNGDNSDTFDDIIGNIIKFKNSSIDLSIRINVDNTNSSLEYLEELLDVLIANDLNKVYVGLGHVKAYNDCNSSIKNICLSNEDYAKLNLSFQEILHAKGFISDNYLYYPRIKSNYCCYDSANAFVIDPDGNMYKCWNDIGTTDRSIGNVNNWNSTCNNDKYMKYINSVLWSPFESDKCRKCKLLPICMGGCPFNGVKAGHPECEKWLYSLYDTLKFTYKCKKEVSIKK
jgi:radical SAM additional 4Fe4S-binding domain